MASLRRRAGTVALFSLFLLVTSCDRGNSSNAPPDEAMKAGRTVEFYKPPLPDDSKYPATAPVAGYAATQPATTTRPVHREIQDYFSGMDAVSVPATAGRTVWPDQLLDQQGLPRSPRHLITTPDLTKSEILGRNTWMLWCGGNEGFWDWLGNHSYGFTDFVKLIDTRKRTARWRDAGMVNEPGMRESPSKDEWGLWLDEPEDEEIAQYRRGAIKKAFKRIEEGKDGIPAVQPDDYEEGYKNENRNGYYEKDLPDAVPPPEIYGFSSGVVGLRLFPNPKFDTDARKKWDAEKFYGKPEYYSNPELIRPYRVGMSCAFCHVSAHPLKPPLDPSRPRWENISGIIGSQYLRTRAVVGNLLPKENFVYHLLDSQPPGTIDTSLVASDNINNPNAMNAIFGVPARVVRSFENPTEQAVGAASTRPSLWRDPAGAPDEIKKLLPKLPESNQPVRQIPRILFDGSDSVGALTALARVYLNIGTYYDQWIKIHDPLVGVSPPDAANAQQRKDGRTQLPFRIDDCEKNSVYWQATAGTRVEALRDYFLKLTQPMPLLDAQSDYAQGNHVDVRKLPRGRRVFAKNCIVCHSSIQPESNFIPADPKDSKKPDPNYHKNHDSVISRRKAAIQKWQADREPWDHDPGQWLRDPDYEKWSFAVVEDADFWRNNFLSTDFRIPVTYIGTNSGRAMATNATNGHMWEDFSSLTNRSLKSVGAIAYYNPFSGKDEFFTPRHKIQDQAPAGGGGPGFYRPSSLISIWATAPFLHNNSLGHFNNDPSVKGRLDAYDDAMRKLLDKGRRLESSDYATAAQLKNDHGLIWRTPCETYLQLPGTHLPGFLRRLPLPKFLLEFSDYLADLGAWRAVPTVLLLIFAFIILLTKRGPARVVRLWRYGAYAAIVAGLFIGFLAYLNTGGFGDLKIGPIPAGTPVNLLANLNSEVPVADLKKAIGIAVAGITEIESGHLKGEDKDRVLKEKVAPALMKVSKCPDFVMDKGHFYPWFADMSAEDKEALIELVKTF
jgi:hypothetical protein